MLPLLPLFLIGKLALAVPARRGALYETDLQEYLRIVDISPTQYLVDSTVGLLSAFHTVLVLLQASDSAFDQTDPNNRKYMEVASFSPEFVKKDAQGKVIGGELKKSQTVIDDITSIDPYGDIVECYDKNYPKNLVRCLEQFQNLPDDFEVRACISSCLNSLDVSHPQCIRSALQLCHSILLSSNLNEVKGWLHDNAANPLTETSQWLKNHVGVSSSTLAAQLASVTDNDTKKSLRQVRAMLFESSLFHREIISRLDWIGTDENGDPEDEGNDIKEAVGKLTSNLSAVEKENWQNLQRALFGAVGWHIVNQARFAASQIAYLLI